MSDIRKKSEDEDFDPDKEATPEQKDKAIEEIVEYLRTCAISGDCESCEKAPTCLRGIKAVLANLLTETNDIRHENNAMATAIRIYFSHDKSHKKVGQIHDSIDNVIRLFMFGIIFIQFIWFLIQIYGL